MNNKKVGLAIVTYGTNYGTYLQAYATQYVVRKLGYDTEVISQSGVASDISRRRKKYFLSQIFNFSELRSYGTVFIGMVYRLFNKDYNRYILGRKNKCEQFKNESFVFSDISESWGMLTKFCEENYAYVLVGSDQLWRPANIAGGFYTLEFVPECVPTIAYATSFGLKSIRGFQKKKIRNFLGKINHVSVREASGADIVSELTCRKIPVVCDPTLLLESKEWERFVSDERIVTEKYILVYFLGANKKHREFVKNLSKNTGYKIVGVLHVAGFNYIDNELCDIVPENIGPMEFLNLVKFSEFVCTDSFHGCVFSIQFRKQLFAFRRFKDCDTMSTNDRINTLFNQLNISQNLVYGDEKIDNCINELIDYDCVHKKLELIRKESYSYLINSFSGQDTDLNTYE